MSQSEIDRINDPNFVLEIAAGPPTVQLHEQQPGTGPIISSQFLPSQHKFLLKKAHFSLDDTRIFDCDDGRVRAASTHLGKNPYGGLDPLGLGNNNGPLGEWKSVCRVAGYNGMPPLKIRPKALSRHGKQYIQSPDGNHTFFTIGNVSRIKSMSIRHNLEVTQGDSDEVAVAILVDMASRTQQFMNAKGERIAQVTKSLKTLIMNASLGAGSELEIEIAKGVDWTAILGIIMGIKQVGAHFVYDAMGNWIQNPLQDKVIEASGMQGAVDTYNHLSGEAQHDAFWGRRLYNEFFH
ncbi:hypothetical protein WJX73_002275 [Symbiochloris irregularis]|uniref:Uncharacterized protein n=1 Tax=Symbiochloris irregularis TaxID=706552 RepID=A0AAW1NUI2_9CHLO